MKWTIMLKPDMNTLYREYANRGTCVIDTVPALLDPFCLTVPLHWQGSIYVKYLNT